MTAGWKGRDGCQGNGTEEKTSRPGGLLGRRPRKGRGHQSRKVGVGGNREPSRKKSL